LPLSVIIIILRDNKVNAMKLDPATGT